jgi:hypothetical protein
LEKVRNRTKILHKHDKDLRNLYLSIALLPAALLIAYIITVPLAYADTVNPGVYAIDSKPFGMSYGEWAAKWWQWDYSIPKKDNPPADMTGAKCAVSQQGPVWFLAGTDGGLAERTCTIPAGKAILFPIINTESSFEGNPQVKTDEGLRAMVKDFIDKTTVLEVTVDGHKLTDLQKYRAQSPKFTLNYPPDNVVGFPPNTSSQAFTDGYWIILEPLAAGKHEISFKGANSQFTSTGITNFATEARYHLTVK